MNRFQRRSLEKKAKQKGFITDEELKKYFSVNSENRSYSERKTVHTGDKVKLDVEQIESRPRYNIMSDGYKQFVSDNVNNVLTAKEYASNMFEVEEDPRWLFWSGDLIVVEENEDDLS